MKALNNEKLAEFIVALGRFNDYGSTKAQTQKALESGTVSELNQDNDDVVIFQDILKALKAIEGEELTVGSIIKINQAFDGDSREQPTHPGILRDGLLRPHTDKIYVRLWPGEKGPVIYEPPLQVEEEDLEKIILNWKIGPKTRLKAWHFFGELAKLQPFQDGNKRTALIAANLAMGALKTQDYLMPPAGRDYLRFLSALMGVYGVGLEGGPITKEQAWLEFEEVMNT